MALVIRFCFWAGWWLFGSTVLAVLLLRHPFGDALLVTRYTGYVLPWLLTGLVPGVVTACATRRWVLAGLLGLSTAIILVTYAPLLLPRKAPSAAPATRIEVMSYNTWSNNGDAVRIAHVVMNRRPDVLLLQEVPPEVFAPLVDSLRDLYGGAPLHRAYEPAVQQGVISRFPIESHASLPRYGEAQTAVLRSPAGRITVYNVHLERGGAWWRRYCEAASILTERVLRERGPVILGGDFNAPDQSQPYKLIAGHLKNAHWETGRGFGFTYPSPEVRLFDVVPGPPLVRIDHIFFSDHFVARRAGTIPDSGGSDHLPVFAALELEPGRAGAGDSRAAVPVSSPGRGRASSPGALGYACP